MVRIRQPVKALLAKRWGPKEQVRNAHSPFYRVRDGPVTSLRSPYDITGDIPNASLTVPGNVSKRLNLSNRTSTERLDTVVP